ncbi:uroporphyrinogen-III synthase [Methanospirillum stamsii]|uniref:Uroporphyrinogen-III synthase n=1 Tax=Methanospirillum stamsii TaxID=1277351 RepID=A0A2V2N4N1_9EURY|nr:uroporphyrinogen-III synthase [Methanospirillum stamsii]PWR73550.1 uroporphyrinogen-III synthase [Methanospirillum stamsii]
MRIAITRLKGKEGDDQARCARRGHDCFSISPMIGEMNHDTIDLFIQDVKDRKFNCIFFTSALPAGQLGPILQDLPLPRVIAIGPQTAKALREYGIICEVLHEFYSRAFVPYLGDWIVNKKVGIPRSDAPNQKLLDGIRDAGGFPIEYQIYSLIPTYELLNLNGAEAILFTSALSFKSALWKRREDLILIAIGDVTAEAMEEAGLSPDVVGDGSLEGTLDELNLFLLMNPGG